LVEFHRTGDGLTIRVAVCPSGWKLAGRFSGNG
jgi:hypothetical protein